MCIRDRSMSDNLQYHFHMLSRSIRSDADQSTLKFYVYARSSVMFLRQIYFCKEQFLSLIHIWDGIPLGVCIDPGNTNEQKTLKPIEQRIISEYGMSKFIVCTDAGLASKANRKFNSINDRAFIVTSPIKKLKSELKEWALSPQGWYISDGNRRKKYDISKLITGDIDEKTQQTFNDTVFYLSLIHI